MISRAGRSSGVEDDELLGCPCHGDIAVDSPLDAGAEAFWVDEDDEVELKALRHLRRQRAHTRRRRECGIAYDAGDSLGVLREPALHDRAEIRRRTVHDRNTGSANGRRHVGVWQGCTNYWLGFSHHLGRCAVVDAQGLHVDLVKTVALKAFLPRLGETVPGLSAVADDRKASRGATLQQHVPLGVRELLSFV